MPFWHVHLAAGSPVAHLVHNQVDDDGGVWSGEIQIWRGAPAWTDHPELEHAILGIMNLGAHADFIRHHWTFDVPDRWEDKWNCGDDREWMVLKATGGPSCWTLVLRFPKRTPQFVWSAVAQGFHARLVGTETEMVGAVSVEVARVTLDHEPTMEEVEDLRAFATEAAGESPTINAEIVLRTPAGEVPIYRNPAVPLGRFSRAQSLALSLGTPEVLKGAQP